MESTINIPAQTLNAKWSFIGLTISINPLNKTFTSVVKYQAKDSTGKIIDTKSITYSGKDYNTWWNSFNSGAYLYSELLAKFPDIQGTIPSTVEGEFVNP